MRSIPGEVCTPNISTAERRKRLLGGVIALLLGLGVLAALLLLGVNRWWRVGLFPLFMGAASGYFQWRDQT
jgi:hypothetical protein